MSANFGLIAVGIIVQFVLGAAFGWWVRGTRKIAAPASTQSQEELRHLVEQQRKQAEEMHQAMNTLHELTDSIGKDVGDHAGRVQQISTNLTSAAQDLDGTGLQSALVDAVSEVAKANEQLQNQLRDAEQKLAEQAQAIEKHMAMARTDALTGLLNRRAFDEELLRRLSEFQRYRTPVSLLLADIDHFKKFNDNHGHQAGDEVLKLTAKSLAKAMRDVDLVCRYGGEEMAVIMPGTDLAGGSMAAERARVAIEKAILEFEGKELRVTVSGGVAAAVSGEDMASLIKRADEALYHSKKAGRNCAHYHDGSQMFPVGTTPTATETPAATAPKPAVDATDPLSQMPNNEAFQNELRRRLENHRKFHTPVAVLLASIDGLAQLRATHGDEGAQRAMRTVAQLLKAAARDHDMVARIAEDRFALVLPGTQLEKAHQLADKMRDAVAKVTLPLKGGVARVTVSCGLAESIGNDVVEEVLSRVTASLDAAIGAGGNKIVCGDLVQQDATLKVTAKPKAATA